MSYLDHNGNEVTLEQLIRSDVGWAASRVREAEKWEQTIGRKEPVAWRYRLSGSPVVSVYPPENPKDWEPLYTLPPDQSAGQRVMRDIRRAVEAWDTTVLDRARDGRMQEAMECLRDVLAATENYP